MIGLWYLHHNNSLEQFTTLAPENNAGMPFGGCAWVSGAVL